MRKRQAKSIGGIDIPDNAQKTEEWGEAVAVGLKCQSVKKHTLVYVGPQQGTHFINEGEDFVLLKEDNILAILKE